MEAAAVQSFGKVGKFEQRRTFTYEGRDIYEWEQSMQEVLVYLNPPAAVTADMIDCKITVQRLVIGLKGNPPFLDVSTSAQVLLHGLRLKLDGALVIRDAASTFWLGRGGGKHVDDG